MSKVVALSLFSGCGGLDIASHMAGVPVIFSLDFDKDSVETLKKNKLFNGAEIHCADVRDFPIQKYKEVLKKHNYKKFILLGGPPCQPFSKAGYWIGNKKRKIEKDPRNMVDEYIRIVRALKPDGFLFENVESLLHPTNKKVIEKLINSIKKLGYDFQVIKALALDYGVSQKRKRIFVIGSKHKFKEGEPKKTHADPSEAKLLGLKPHENVGKFIKKFNTKKYFEPEEVTTKGTYGKHLKLIPPGENYFALTTERGCKNPKFKGNTRFWSFLLKLSPDKPSWTIVAQPGPWVGPFHWNNRRLRVPEIAAIQTFPARYKFYGSRRSIQKQIGNAVPPLMGKAMIGFLKDNL